MISREFPSICASAGKQQKYVKVIFKVCKKMHWAEVENYEKKSSRPPKKTLKASRKVPFQSRKIDTKLDEFSCMIYQDIRTKKHCEFFFNFQCSQRRWSVVSINSGRWICTVFSWIKDHGFDRELNPGHSGSQLSTLPLRYYVAQKFRKKFCFYIKYV